MVESGQRILKLLTLCKPMIINIKLEDALRYDILRARYTRLERSRSCVPAHKISQYYDLMAMICQEIGDLINPLLNADNEVIRLR